MAMVTESWRFAMGTSSTVVLEYKVTLVMALIIFKLTSLYAFSRVDLMEKNTGLSWNVFSRELIAP